MAGNDTDGVPPAARNPDRHRRHTVVGATRIPRRTLKRIYADLPPEDQRIVEGLPLPDGTPDSIVACHLAIAAEFLPRVRVLIESVGGRWPDELFDATDHYLRTNVGVGFELDDYRSA